MDLKETDILGEEIGNHWYYHSKAKAMTLLLDGSESKKILDIGAGSAFFSRHLLINTPAEEAWCVDTSYAADSDEAEGSKPLYLRRSVDQLDADLVLLMDVLEHVDDDVGLLASYVAKVPVGATFLISVPAFQFLWSGHDEFLEHKRRYTLQQLEKVVRDAGLSVKQGVYYFGGVFPIAAGLRLAKSKVNQEQAPQSQLQAHGWLVNNSLKAICNFELPLMKLNRAAGLTAFCLARKDKQA